MKWGCRGHWGHWDCWGCRGHWGCKGFKAWKITTEDFRVIHVLEMSFTLMFWRRKRNDRIMKYHVEFSTFSVGGCWGQPMLLFWKLVHETQNFKPREPTMHHNSIKVLILLPVRADFALHTSMWDTLYILVPSKPPVDLNLIFEISSLKNPFRWTWFFVYFKLDFCRLHRQ